jgi:hypothetical protein
VMESFDLPAMIPNCVQRSVSVIAPQALHMMNDGMIAGLAEAFAARVRKEAPSDVEKQIEKAYWIALSRPPNDEEKKVSLDIVRRLRDVKTKATIASPSGVAAKPAADQPPGVEDPSAMALEEFCHTLMSSAAMLYID